WINGKALRWVVPICLLLIFILQFFPWVGIYPGGVPAVTQSAYGAAFSGYTQDLDMKKFFPMPTAAELKKLKEADSPVKDPRPGISVLMLIYFIPFFFVTLLLGIG